MPDSYRIHTGFTPYSYPLYTRFIPDSYPLYTPDLCSMHTRCMLDVYLIYNRSPRRRTAVESHGREIVKRDEGIIQRNKQQKSRNQSSNSMGNTGGNGRRAVAPVLWVAPIIVALAKVICTIVATGDTWGCTCNSRVLISKRMCCLSRV